MFIMLDGIDGSGKSAIIQGLVEEFITQKKQVAFLKDDWNNNGKILEPNTYKDYDLIVSAEPTTVWIGAAIRQEIIVRGEEYSGISTAQAYALDRLVLYKRLLIPLLTAGKTIIQDRGVSTSLCYQPIQDQKLSVREVAELEGNALALQYRPDHLIIADVPVDIALGRLGGRSEKQDNARFEKKEFLEKARRGFMSAEFQNLFTEKGTSIHALNTDTPIDIMKQDAISLFKNLGIV